MTDTETWIVETRKYLEKAHTTDGETMAVRLEDQIGRLDLQRIQTDLGCGDDCVECSWGTLGGQPLGNEPCRVLLLQQGIFELRQKIRSGASARQEASRLLELLDTLPQHRP